MKITKNQAESIVNQVMKVIPYNINIMNEEGIIIGSGDSDRIGKIHLGALEALERKGIVEVNHGTKIVKPGINIPIFFGESPIGVIGITGKPEIVLPFGELVRVMAELLINQYFILNQKSIKREQIEEYLYELSYRTRSYSKNFIERGLTIGINIKKSEVAVLLIFKNSTRDEILKRIKFLLNDGEYYLVLNPEKIALFMNSSSNIEERLNKFIERYSNIEVKFGIGVKSSIYSESLEEANKILELGQQIEPERAIFSYDKLGFLSILAEFKNDHRFIRIRKELIKINNLDPIRTIISYVQLNGEANKIAEKLHIHRNTLKYRLDKIKESTGKNPYNYKDFLELFIASTISDF